MDRNLVRGLAPGVDNPWSKIGQLCRSLGLHVVLFLLLAMVPGWAQAQQGSIRGDAFLDANSNGRRDPGEPGRSGLGIAAVGDGGTFGALTGSDGRYSVDGLPPGRYYVSAASLAGTKNAESGSFVNVNGGVAVGPDFPIEEDCAKIQVKRIIWLRDPAGCFQMTFTVTNLAPYPIGHIFALVNPPVVVQSPLTGSPNYIPVSPAIPPGGTATFTVTVCGVPPGSTWTLELALHDPKLETCCGSQVTIKVPVCDCFQVLDETITCNPDGTVTWCGTIQNLQPIPVFWFLIAPLPGITINPTVTSLPGVPQWGTFQICITITGAVPGTTITLPMILRDRFKECCRMEIPIDIPICQCLQPGQCFDKAPLYNDDKVPNGSGGSGTYASLFPGTVAVITCCIAPGSVNNVNTLDLPAVAVHNLNNYQTTAVPFSQDWVPAGLPRGYSGPVSSSSPMGAWTVRQLGSVFGVTLDKYGNIFVTHSSAYNYDYLGAVGGNQPGWIYMIRNGSATMHAYCRLPNVLDASAPANGFDSYYPGLGNISYDGVHDQLFVTNHEDGKIYRVAGTGGVNTSGAILSSYDPQGIAGFTVDNGSAGMVNIGDRLWGVQFHRDRVYFSRWQVDMGQQDITKNNEIWSIDINVGSGNFGSALQKEITVPHYPGQIYSQPVSDISFSKEGKMMLAERGAAFGQPNWSGTYDMHKARGLEYTCEGIGAWIPSPNTYDVGASGNSNGAITNGWQSCSGGTDYDYSTASISNNPNSGGRVWFTMNGWYVAASGQILYGIQGFNPNTGGNSSNSIYNDADGNLFDSSVKSYIGDVEIPCPPDPTGGHVRLQGLSGNPNGRRITVTAYTNAGSLVGSAVTTIDAEGRFTVPIRLDTGTYRIAIQSKCFLRKAINGVAAGSTNTEFVLLCGDIDGDNAVSILDYILLTSNYGANSSDANWTIPGSSGLSPMECDLDGDGEISILDYLLMSDNFGREGD